MKSQDIEFPLEDIIAVFNQINEKSILAIAKNIQKQLISDNNLILSSDNSEYKSVTRADIEIQNILLDYFGNSILKNTYQTIAEENILNKKNNNRASWKLLIDPLDGTTAFSKQRETWGIMIGACDMKGELKYSYNIVSNSQVFKTENSIKPMLKSFNQLIEEGKKILIDIYNYGSSTSSSFNSVFEKKLNINNFQYEQTSYSSAIWAGYKMYLGKLNGLLWLPSNKGKKWYPDYDLIFLGALFSRGYNIMIGRTNNKNSLIAVAPTFKDVERLYETGLLLLPLDKKRGIKKFINTLKITN